MSASHRPSKTSPAALLLMIAISTQLVSHVCLARYLYGYPEEIRALRNNDRDYHRLATRQYFDALSGMALGKRAFDRDRMGPRLQFFDPLGGMALGKRGVPFMQHQDAIGGII